MNEQNKVNKGIEDIERTEYFTVPDGYFKDLPQTIQSKAVSTSQVGRRIYLIPVLKFAIPTLLVVIMVYFATTFNTTVEGSDFIGEVTTEEVLDYLEETDLSSSEIIMAAISEDELANYLEIPTMAEEFIYEESILSDIDWIEDEQRDKGEI